VSSKTSKAAVGPLASQVDRSSINVVSLSNPEMKIIQQRYRAKDAVLFLFFFWLEMKGKITTILFAVLSRKNEACRQLFPDQLARSLE
jgi:hypothetical protein